MKLNVWWSDIISVDSQLISVLFCLSRPEPPSPGQTNGISTPEQLTGRFQVSAAAPRELNVSAVCPITGISRTEFSISVWFKTSACFIWTMCCFDYTGCAASFLLMHASHICFWHICLAHCAGDGSNARHCNDLVLVPVFYWDHESQRTTYNTWDTECKICSPV